MIKQALVMLTFFLIFLNKKICKYGIIKIIFKFFGINISSKI